MYHEDEIEVFIEQYMRISPLMMERERERVKEMIMRRLEGVVDEALTNAVARWNRAQDAKRHRDNFFRVGPIDPSGR